MVERKLSKVVLIVLFLVFIGLIIGFKYSFEHWFDPVSEKDEKVVSNLGDEFILQYVTRDFPDLSTDVTIMDSKRKDKIAYYVIDGEFYRPALLTITDVDRIRCYQIYEV